MQQPDRQVVGRACMHELAAVLAYPGLQASVLEQPALPAWQQELADAVEHEQFILPRVELAGITLDAAANWLEKTLPHGAVSRDIRDALLSDILNLLYLQESLTGVASFRVRLFTGVPDRRCGFHVDTVQPGMPVWGVLKVYNGAGTHWVAPGQVRSMQAFYHWLQARDAVVRRYADDTVVRDRQLERLDDFPAFLQASACIEEIPSGTAVVFRHLSAEYHWSDHSPWRAWIHCSPMSGQARLVINISSGHQWIDS